VQNLLDMSRIQAGVLRPRCSASSLKDLVAAVVDELAPRGYDLATEISDDLPPINVDVVLISRVLANLLENAIRHSPKFAPITVQAALIGQHVIEVTVTDKGPGVSKHRRHEIFELFARRSDDAGAGLGLTIAKTFIEAHGQRIWVEDAPGGGAKFCFTLPVAANLSEETRFVANSHS
jgi:two-component system sensor histidine kinase KdpD